ncbi:TPA_exp: hypothetical protein A8136_2188 [Trichophyton benhamiae CBS 112371]|nr:TPA_exp: hypothetical protein A8136_2188 [Trichophyton benhamiae CBS 112371]
MPKLLSFRSATWIYPLQGIVYFIFHPFLWPLFRSRLLPITLLSLFIYTILFVFTYLPQVAFLAIFHGPGAWVNGAFLVLAEGAAIVAMLFEAFFVDEAQVDVFDSVLLHEAMKRPLEDPTSVSDPASNTQPSSSFRSHIISMMSESRSLDLSNYTNPLTHKVEDPEKWLGKPLHTAIYAPFSFRQIIELILLLPLNLVPAIGTPLFLVLTGYRAGPFHHWRYFQLRDFNRKERKEYIHKRMLRYTLFGTIALVLQLVPGLSMFFLLSTAAGSALWARDMERRRWLVALDAAGDNGHNDRPSEQYHDNPV